MPVVSPVEQGSTPEPEALELNPAPVRAAQVMPRGAPVQESSPPKRGGKGLWVGASVAAVVLIGGVAALVVPSKPQAPEASASVPGTSAPADAPAPATPPAVAAAPAPEPVLTEAPDAGSPDAGAVAAVAMLPSEPPEAPTGNAGQTQAEQAPRRAGQGDAHRQGRPLC